TRDATTYILGTLSNAGMLAHLCDAFNDEKELPIAPAQNIKYLFSWSLADDIKGAGLDHLFGTTDDTLVNDNIIQSDRAQIDLLFILEQCQLEPELEGVPSTIDIKPCNFPNPINLKSGGKIPVAILSTPSFDAPAIVDVSTVYFGRTGTETEAAAELFAQEDVDGDGDIDLILKFKTKDTDIQCGDDTATLTGFTISSEGSVFFSGSGPIKITKC
ncbi:MAG: hypothetical protein IIC84_10125, partial [Chloroflexi bacterium]|nr:hypothetical protein [Chloroflexota bacterium]